MEPGETDPRKDTLAVNVCICCALQRKLKKKNVVLMKIGEEF